MLFFLRKELKEREQQAYIDAATRLECDLAVLAVQSRMSDGKGAADAMAIGNNLLAQLKSTEAVGRLVVKLVDL